MKLCICTLYTPHVAALAAITVPANRRYAARHGHDFVAKAGNLTDRPPSWDKIVLVNHLLPLYDWVLWIDADAVFTGAADVADCIPPWAVPPAAVQPELILGRQHNGINAGVFFLKNCQQGLQFLQDTWQQTPFIHHGWWEQAAMIHLLEQKPDRIRTQVVDQPTFNRLPQDHQPGDLVMHAAGRPMADRIDLLKAAAGIG